MISIIGSEERASIVFLCASNALDNILLIDHTKSKAIDESLDITNAIPSTLINMNIKKELIIWY